jgi:5-methylcytosine-specific restriction endonuclease McrA
MAMGRDCFAHRHREDVPLEVHHIWPTGNGGPNIKPNRVSLCANAHSATHDLLTRTLRAGRPLPWSVRRRYGRKIRRLAAAGFTAITTRTITLP